MNYVKANFPVYDLPLSGYLALRPERAQLIVPTGASLALGAMCYRETKHVGNKCYIVPSSLIKARIPWVKKVIYLFSELIEYDSRREISIIGIFRTFAAFIRWCDSKGLHDVLTGDKDKDYEAYRLYSSHLAEKVKTHQVKSGSSAATQSQIKEVYTGIFEDPQFYQGVPNLPKRNDTKSIEVPCEDRQSKALSLCMSIFQGMTEFVLEGIPYPHFIKAPGYLDFKDGGFWIFHSARWMSLGHIYADQSISIGLIDYVTGAARDPEELSELTGDPLILCKRRVRKYELCCEKANLNIRSPSRLDRARMAMSAFYILFIANTGMNGAQAKSLEWSGEFTEERSKFGFKIIKYRASGKVVHFEIQSRFVKHFRKYLKLREFINKGSPVNLLFGYQGVNRVTTPNIKSLVCIANKLDPSLAFIMPMEWRAAKSDWFIRNYDPSTAALSLQNNEKTILKHYAEGSHAVQASEFGAFLDSISKLDIKVDDSSNAQAASSVGHCSDPMHPKPLIRVQAIEPNCKQPEGCLFCDKFVIHSDEKDIRKLYSCLFCIDQTAHLSASIDEYENTFGAVRQRINLIVAKVASLSEEHKLMASRIKDEVMEDELLDPYWESKLSMLIEIGVV